jgi:hypothetical protein
MYVTQKVACAATSSQGTIARLFRGAKQKVTKIPNYDFGRHLPLRSRLPGRQLRGSPGVSAQGGGLQSWALWSWGPQSLPLSLNLFWEGLPTWDGNEGVFVACYQQHKSTLGLSGQPVSTPSPSPPVPPRRRRGWGGGGRGTPERGSRIL